MKNPDRIISALHTQAPVPDIAQKVGSSHWRSVCTVVTETDEFYLVTGYDSCRPSLRECTGVVPLPREGFSIYMVIDRDHPAILELNRQNEPHCHYTGP